MKKLAFSVCGVLVLGFFAQVAQAQWSWKDDAGHTVFSDQPPPAGIPPSRILRTPSGGTVSTVPAGDQASSGDASKPKSVAEQNAEFAKRQKDAAEAAKKAADEKAAKQANAERCASNQQSLNALQSGQRMATVDAQGNRTYLDDSQRQAQIAKTQAAMAGC